MRYWFVVFLWLMLVGDVFARESVTLTEDDMAQVIKAEFAEQGLGEDVEIEFFGGQTNFVIKEADHVKIMVSSLDISQGQNKFTAKAEIFADGQPAGQTKLLGRYFVMTEVMMPSHDISKGSILRKEDFVRAKVRSNRLREDMVTLEENLVGKQAAKLIKANRPVSAKDIRDEVLIKKGQKVTVIYQHNTLQIVAKMEALEDGVKGQYIKILNTKSDRELAAKVLDKNTVEVAAE